MLKNYYVSANTAEGYIDLLSSNLHGIKETIELESHSYQMNTKILQQLIEQYKDKTPVEVLKSPISERYVEGIILREKEVAIIGERKSPFTTEAYEQFKQGLRIHDNLEKVYIQEMDFTKANQLADDFTKKLLANESKIGRTPHIYRRLFGTNTVDGVVNEVPNLTEHLKQVYHIKGRAGTGKSTFMKRVAEACLNHGFDLEIYHCSFDPNSIDMVLIPALQICLFDSTDPHRFEPQDTSREVIIDLYEETVTPGTDEKYAEEINKLTKEYKSFMKKGLAVIKAEGEKIIAADDKRPFSQMEVDGIVSELQAKIN